MGWPIGVEGVANRAYSVAAHNAAWCGAAAGRQEAGPRRRPAATAGPGAAGRRAGAARGRVSGRGLGRVRRQPDMAAQTDGHQPAEYRGLDR